MMDEKTMKSITLPKLEFTDIFPSLSKISDELPISHYLSWNPIHTGTPDFHRPEFFGGIRFV